MVEINPFADEAPHPYKEMLEDIGFQLEMLERRREYLLELKEYYENAGNNAADLQTPPSAV